MSNLIQPYPLAWPAAYPRTAPQRRQATGLFRTSFQQCRWDLMGEIMRFHATDIVLSTNLRTNDQGEPIYDHEPNDPGVALWFKLRKESKVEQMAVACDKWKTVHMNMGALAATMMGLRGMYRFGTTHVLDALLGGLVVPPEAIISDPGGQPRTPEPTTDGVTAGWWNVFGFMHPAEASLEEVEKRYRARVKQVHPDVEGGDPEAMRIFNEAIEQARNHFAPTGEHTT